ncbi:hypothetical protein CRE_27224 [Caenorhabditis remanei]|uniref:Uncharacterized protein n=1 Tax=Caenorhabditis remanei TaxID=31234 RepID=E3LP62_CAERE|nr:hypothetical protein CRE_27224 [Caenorhabditis remanei]
MNVVDELCKNVIEENSISAKQSLENLRDQVSTVIEHNYVQLFAKIQTVLYFVYGQYYEAERIIFFGYFDQVHHSFFQYIYRKIQENKTGTKLDPMDYCRFPLSIDPIYQDGLTKSMCEYLKNYYMSRRNSKKALKLKSLAAKTGLSLDVIEARFKKCRDELPVRRQAKKRINNERADEDYCEYENFDFYQECYNNPEYQLYPTPPSSGFSVYHQFPLTRVPLDQPLTIQIPDETQFPISFI